MEEDRDAKGPKYVVKFWLILLALVVVGLVVFALLFGLKQGR